MKVILLQAWIDNPVTKRGGVHREEQLAQALAEGLAAEGDEFEAMSPPADPCELDCDIVAFVGMKRQDWFKWCRRNDQRCMYFDKGYYHREFAHRKDIILWRVCVDTQQPLEYIERARHSPERWNRLGREMAPWRRETKDGHIIVANSSSKYHQFYDLPEPTEWVRQIVDELRKHTKREIWYRPKPSYAPRGAGPVSGTRYCPIEPLAQLFPKCHALVTHGSYICVDALLNGVPGVIVGPGITRPISSTDLAEIEEPRLASDDERLQILANMAWCQYRLGEWKSGLAWRNVKRLFIQ